MKACVEELEAKVVPVQKMREEKKKMFTEALHVVPRKGANGVKANNTHAYRHNP